MIKLVYCITKKPGLSDKEFFDYWKNLHGAIGANIPGLRKLVQSHTISGTKGCPENRVFQAWYHTSSKQTLEDLRWT
jgi:hypothetical protein